MTTPAPPIPTNQSWLGQFLAAVLERAAAALGAQAPARRYVAAGTPIPDCGQLTVHIIRIRSSDPLTRQQLLPGGSLSVVPVADIAVTYYRCVEAVPTQQGLAPSLAALDADGRMFAAIGQALWYGLTADSVDGTLWPLQNKPAVLWRQAEQLSPSGAMAGWQLTAEVSLT